MPKRFDIRLIAPSGYADDPAASQRGIERLEAAGHTIHGASVLDRVSLRFAGTDAERVDDINQLADTGRPLPDLVMATCGGYGAITLLSSIDFEGLAARFAVDSCVFVGHGDFTVLQSALYARSGVSSMHGPMLVQDFGAAYLREGTWRHFWQTVSSPRMEVSWTSHDPGPDLHFKGTLWGGNLSALCSLIGTPYMPKVDSGILYLEDSGEQAYRIERMLYELKLGRVLEGQRAIIVGDLGGYRVSEYDNGYDIDHALDRFAAICGVPIIRGLAFGHGLDKLTLPFGAPAVLEASNGTASLTAYGYPHLGNEGGPSHTALP